MILRDQRIYLDGLELTSHTNSVAIDQSVDVKDVTPFGAISRRKAPGLKSTGVGIQGFYDANVDEKAQKVFSSSNAAMVITAQGANTGDIAYFSKINTAQFSTNAAVGEVYEMNLSGETNENLIRGVIAFYGENITESTISPTINFGTVPTGKQISVCVQLFGNQAPEDSLQVFVESDATNSFIGDEVVEIDMMPLTGVSGAIERSQTPVINEFVRVRLDPVGASPSMKAVVTIGLI